MMHAVCIDDKPFNGKKISKELRHYRKGVRLEDSIANNSVPEGYMTSESFWKEADKRIVNVCKRYGVL